MYKHVVEKIRDLLIFRRVNSDAVELYSIVNNKSLSYKADP